MENNSIDPNKSLFINMSEQVPEVCRNLLAQHFEGKTGFIAPLMLFFYLAKVSFAGGKLHRGWMHKRKCYIYILPKSSGGVLVLRLISEDQHLLEFYENLDAKLQGPSFTFLERPFFKIMGQHVPELEEVNGVCNFSNPNEMPHALQFRKGRRIFKTVTQIQELFCELIFERELVLFGEEARTPG